MSQALLDRISVELKKCLNHEANELQESINELTSAFEEYCNAFEGLKEDNEKLQTNANNLLKANTALTQTIKAVQIILGAHRDKVKKFKNMPELIASLDNFVLTDAAINAGALSEAVKEFSNGKN